MFKKELFNVIKHHLGKHKDRAIEKWVGFVQKLNHKLVHVEEILLVLIIAFFSVMMAHFTGLSDEFYAATNQTIESKLQEAITKVNPNAEANKIINKRTFDGSVKSRFYPGYCTYFAALITPEIFTYISPTEQNAPFGGNAKDRCVNAQSVGIPTGKEPRIGSLIIYKGGVDGISPYGHVGRIMYVNEKYKKMIVRDGNYIEKFVATDRRESTENAYIDCYIYPPNNQITNPNFVNPNAVKPINEQEIEKMENAVTPVTTPETIVTATGSQNATGTTIPEVIMPEVTTPPVENIEISVPSVTNTFDTSKFTPELQHFLTQRNLEIEETLQGTPMKVGEERTITISFKKPGSEEKFSGILPQAMMLIPSSNSIKLDYTAIQLVYNGKVVVHVKAEQAGTASVLVNFGTETIQKIDVKVE